MKLHLRWGLVALFALALPLALGLWACSETTENPTSPQLNQANTYSAELPVFAEAIGVQNRHVPDLLSTQGVAGSAVGADDRGRPVIRVYTLEALPQGRVPGVIEGYRVDQVVTGPIVAHKGPPPMDGGGSTTDPRALQTPPVKMGTSGGWRYDLANGYCCGGTLGALITNGSGKYILSNYHVLYADIVNGGNNRSASPGDAVIQPGLIDVNCNANSAQNIGILVANGGSLPGAGVDCGIALINGSVDASGAILNVGTISSGTLNASVGMKVKKMGRTTGLTRSSVDGINGAFSITYENECAGGTAFTETYTGQIVIKNRRCKFQDGGDSGSLLVEDVDTDPRAVGLCFAGSSICSNQSIAIANPIGDVLSHYGNELGGNWSMVGN
jgi:hypothetical protein